MTFLWYINNLKTDYNLCDQDHFLTSNDPSLSVSHKTPFIWVICIGEKINSATSGVLLGQNIPTYLQVTYFEFRESFFSRFYSYRWFTSVQAVVWLLDYVIYLKLRRKYVTVAKTEQIEKKDNYFHSKWQFLTILGWK